MAVPSLMVKLKVKVSNMALASGQYRQSHRNRRPSEKMRQLNGTSYTNDLIGEIDLTAEPEQSFKTPRRKGPVSRKGTSSTIRNRKKRKRWEDGDAEEYGSHSQSRSRNGRKRLTEQDVSVDLAYQQPVEEDIELSQRGQQELTLDDFVGPTEYGFPVQTKRCEPTEDEKGFMLMAQTHKDILLQHKVDSHSATLPPSRNVSFPNTLEFWLDWFMAEQAFRSSNIDFKLMCLNLMKLRDKSDIPKITVDNPLSDGITYFFGWKIRPPGMEVSDDFTVQPSRDILPPYGVNCRKDPDDSSILLTYTDWDVLLASIGMAREEMYNRRRWKIKGKHNQAGWVLWKTRMNKTFRGTSIAEDDLEKRNGDCLLMAGGGHNTVSRAIFVRGPSDELAREMKTSLGVPLGVSSRYDRRNVDDVDENPNQDTGIDLDDAELRNMSVDSSSQHQYGDNLAWSELRSRCEPLVQKYTRGEEPIAHDVDLGYMDFQPGTLHTKRRLFTAKSLMNME